MVLVSMQSALPSAPVISRRLILQRSFHDFPDGFRERLRVFRENSKRSWFISKETFPVRIGLDIFPEPG
jgi:hypothetical protein